MMELIKLIVRIILGQILFGFCRCNEESQTTAVVVRPKRQFFPCNGCCGGTFGLQCCVYPGVLSSRCVTDADCLIANSVCLENCCQCPTGFCPNACGECVEVPKCLGDACATDAECSKNVNHAVCTGGICQCSSAYKPVHNSCVARCLGDQCGADADCSTNVPNSICTLGTCQCVNGFVPNVCGRCVTPIVLPGVAARVLKVAAAFDSATKPVAIESTEAIMTTPYHAYTKEANEEIIKTTTAETTSTSTSTSTAQIGLLEPDVVLTGTNSIIRTDGRLFAGDKQEKKEANPAVQVRRDWAYEDIPEDKKTTEAAESKQKFRLEIRNGTVQKTPIL